MFLLVAYDIVGQRRRTRVAGVCEDFGVRVQQSTFECHLSGAEVDDLCDRLADEIDAETDSVRVYRLCAPCMDRIRVLGCGEVSEDADVYVV
jgi:CRISPR-associated protein Cas2